MNNEAISKIKELLDQFAHIVGWDVATRDFEKIKQDFAEAIVKYLKEDEFDIRNIVFNLLNNNDTKGKVVIENSKIKTEVEIGINTLTINGEDKIVGGRLGKEEINKGKVQQ